MIFDNKRVGVCVCKHIFNKQRDVKFIEVFEDGMISLSCGEDDHSSDEDEENEFFWIHAEHVLDSNPSLLEIANLKPGSAMIKTSAGWEKTVF